MARVPLIEVAFAASLLLSTASGAFAQDATQPGADTPQGKAAIVPQSMQDERRPAQAGQDDMDLGVPEAGARPRDPNDVDELPHVPDSARPHPDEAELGDTTEAAAQGAPAPGKPVDLDNEGRRGAAGTAELEEVEGLVNEDPTDLPAD